MGEAHAMQIIRPLHILLGPQSRPPTIVNVCAVQLTSVTEEEGWKSRPHGLNTDEPLKTAYSTLSLKSAHAIHQVSCMYNMSTVKTVDHR